MWTLFCASWLIKSSGCSEINHSIDRSFRSYLLSKTPLINPQRVRVHNYFAQRVPSKFCSIQRLLRHCIQTCIQKTLTLTIHAQRRNEVRKFFDSSVVVALYYPSLLIKTDSHTPDQHRFEAT